MKRGFVILSIVLLLGAGLVLGLLIRARTESSNIRILRLPHTLSADHPVHTALVKMAQEVEKESKGSLRIQIYENGLLGDGSQIKELMQLGAVDIGKFSACDFEDNIPQMAAFSLPYLFADSEHYWRVLNSELGREILHAGTSAVGLCYFDAGARSFYATSPVHTPEELHGKKIRVMVSALMVAGVEALGATPTSMAWGELFTALQNKTVDGAENNIPSFYTSRHYEVCPYFAFSEHFRNPDILMIRKECFDSLSPEHRRILEEAARHASDFQRSLWESETQRYIKLMSKNVTFSKVDQAAMRKRIEPFYQNLREKAKSDQRTKTIIETFDRIRQMEVHHD